jgi:hypothetical protein
MVAEIQTQQVANNSFFRYLREIDDDEFASFFFRNITSFSENHELPILPRSPRTFQERDYLAGFAAESPMIDRVLQVAWLLLVPSSKTE